MKDQTDIHYAKAHSSNAVCGYPIYAGINYEMNPEDGITCGYCNSVLDLEDLPRTDYSTVNPDNLPATVRSFDRHGKRWRCMKCAGTFRISDVEQHHLWHNNVDKILREASELVSAFKD